MRKQLGLFGEVDSPHFGAIIDGSYADVDELVGGAGIGRQPFTAYEEWGSTATSGTRFGDHTFNFNYSHFQQNDVNRTDQVTPMVANPGSAAGPGPIAIFAACS